MSSDQPNKIMDWDELRRHAEMRPAMFIGSSETGHTLAIRGAIRLVWQAKVFIRPKKVVIDLSPNQYLVRVVAGPLVRPIQEIVHFGTDTTLLGSIGRGFSSYFENQRQESEARGIDILNQRSSRGWRYCFSGPTGPRLSEPSYPSILANSLVWGLRTNEGLWCEAYQHGKPTGRPFLTSGASPVGCFSAGSLDPRWFTGLPYDKEDVAIFMSYSTRRPEVTDRRFLSRPAWTPGPMTVNWHPYDDIVTDRTLTADGLKEWLQPIA